MTVDMPEDRYSYTRLVRYVQSVEAAYSVSIKFWLDLVEDPGNGAHARIFVWGSGDAFDRIPSGVQSRPSWVMADDTYPMGEAIYDAVLQLVAILRKVREPIGPPPSL